MVEEALEQILSKINFQTVSMLMIKNSNLKIDVEYAIVAFAWVLKFVGSKRIVGCWDRIAKSRVSCQKGPICHA